MLDELISAIAGQPDFDEWGEVILESAEWQDLAVTLSISLTYSEECLGRWRVSCPNVRNINLGYERHRNTLQLLTDHVLLWPHTRPNVQLYYTGRVANPAAVMGDIWEVHRTLVGSWFSLDHFLTRLPPHLKYLDGGAGMFAQGPVELIEAYAGILRLHGFVVSSLPPTMPGWWDGSDWIPEPSPMHVLLMGESFIVAPQFDAETQRTRVSVYDP